MPDKTKSAPTFAAVVTSTGRKVEGFTSKFATDAAASAAIFADPKASAFAKDIARDCIPSRLESSRKKRGNKFSEARRFWLHKIASDSVKPAPPTPLLESGHLVPTEETKNFSLDERRFLIEGKVVSKKWKDNPFAPSPKFSGGWWGSANDATLKMTVALPDGNRLWGTVPARLVAAVKDGAKTVRFTAKVKASDKDENFGFFSFPKAA